MQLGPKPSALTGSIGWWYGTCYGKSDPKIQKDSTFYSVQILLLMAQCRLHDLTKIKTWRNSSMS